MRAGAGLRALALALLLAGGAIPAAGADPSEPRGADPSADAVRLDYAPDAADAATLVCSLHPASPLVSRFALSYFQPLVQTLTFDAGVWGPDGNLVLPGARRYSSRLTFQVAGGAWERDLVPPGGEATVSLDLTPPVLRETWVWPDGLRLERVCFQPAFGKGIGIRFRLENPTAETFSGLRLTARLQDPELRGRSPRSAEEADDGLLVDPRLEVLYQRDGRTREESWLGAGWSLLGGRISGGEETARRTPADGAGMTVSLETPARDLGPGQTQEAVFWLAWDYDQESVGHALNTWRQRDPYEAWERKCRQAAANGPRFACRDPYLVFLYQTLKAWAPWLRRQDDYGAVFLGSVADPEPAGACELAEGALGFAWLGHGADLTAAYEAWLSQRLELKDVASAILAIHRTWLVTRDQRWLRDNLPYLQEWLDMLAAADEDRDGLPDYFGAVPANPERYAAFPPQEWGPDPGVQYLDTALASLLAFRSGAELLQAGDEATEHLQAARFRMLSDQGEKTLDARFWLPRLGPRGFYAYALRAASGERSRHRGLAAAIAVTARCGVPAHQAVLFQDLWNQPGWRGPHGAFRTLPADDPDFIGDASPGRGAVSYAKTHRVFLAALERRETAAAALEDLRAYARELVRDPGSLGWMTPGNPSLNGVTLGEYSFVELMVRGLAGLDPTAEGLRVHVPAYPEDLDVRFEGLAYGGRRLDVEVKGPGGRSGGSVRVNGRVLADGALVPPGWLAGSRTRILISRGQADTTPAPAE